MIPSFLIGPLAGAAGMALAGAAFFGWLVLIHDPAIRAAQVAEIAAVVAQERERQHEAATAALEAQATAQAALDAAIAPTRRRIASAPVSSACVSSGPIRAALDGLRQPRPAGVVAPGGAGQPADLPVPARAP